MKNKVLMGLFLILVINLIYGCTTTGNVVAPQQPKCRDVNVPYEAQEEYMKTEYYTETVPYTDEECEDKQLIYKMEKGSCQDRQSGLFGLGDKPAKYSCEITNLDSEGGTFSVTIGFITEDNQELEKSLNKYIYPQSTETFSYEVDAGINRCYCSEKSIPTKQICRDVIKYREVQRERQVTAYRPVTKYKTEQKCD